VFKPSLKLKAIAAMVRAFEVKFAFEGQSGAACTVSRKNADGEWQAIRKFPRWRRPFVKGGPPPPPVIDLPFTER
jgi:hypothetical protein